MSNKNFSSFENLVNLFTDLGNKLKTKVETVLLKDTVGWIGKNLLSISSSVITQEQDGVTFTVNRNSNAEVTSIVANGASSAENSQLPIPIPSDLVGNFLFNGCPAGGGTTQNLHHDVYIWNNTNNERAKKWNGVDPCVSDYGETSQEVKLESGKSYVIVCRINSSAGTVTDLTFHPMIRNANEKDDTFEPAHKSVADSLDVWTPTAIVSNGAVTFTNLNDAYNYSKPFFQDGLYTVTEMTKSGSGSAMSLTFATNAPDGTAAKLRIVN